MTRLTIPFVGGRQLDRAFAINSQRAVNWYPELEGDGAKAVLSLKPTPGLRYITTAGNGPNRSNFHHWDFDDRCYFVSGAQLMSIDASWAVTAVGTLNTSTGACRMALGRTHLLVVDGADGYTWNGTTFATVTDADFQTSPSYCAYIDGYFVTVGTDANQEDEWQISGSDDPTSWDALDFATAEADPDDALAVAVTYRDLYILGGITTQVYYNSGNADFPFELYANGVLEWGIHAPASLARVGGNLFLLAQQKDSDPTPILVNGFRASRIADPDMAETIASMATTSDAVGFAYMQRDQTFYELTFPTTDATYVYHVEQEMWHERKSWALGRHRANGHGTFSGRHLVGDYQTGAIYYFDPEYYTDNGAIIERMRRMAAMHRDGRQLEINSLEIEFKRGVGLVSGQGSDPQAMLRYSRDGGNTWSSEITRPIGKIGEYGRRAIWNRLGQAVDFRAELRITDPVEAIVLAAYADVEVLDA